jgi:hypothetical protein
MLASRILLATLLPDPALLAAASAGVLPHPKLPVMVVEAAVAMHQA